MGLRALFHYLRKSKKIIVLSLSLELIFFSGAQDTKGEKKVTDSYKAFYHENKSVSTSLKNDETPLNTTLPFNQDISILNTYGTQSIDLEYTGTRQYFKIMVLFSSANKTQQDINILLNGQRITNWQATSSMGDNLNQKKAAIESYVELNPGNIITLRGSNTKSGQTGSDYIKIVKTSADQMPNLNPIADFKTNIQGTTVSPGAPQTPKDPDDTPVEFVFDASGSNDTDGYIISYLWNFGDGLTASGEEVRHAYELPGTYTISLTVIDNDNAWHTITTEITITIPENTNKSVVAQFTVSEHNSIMEHALLFNAVISKDQKEYANVSYDWNMGDGTKLKGETVYHTYRQTGTYYPSLTVTNETGESSQYSDTIVIREYNVVPEAYAGDDKVLLLPNNNTTLSGVGKDEDGYIIAHRWIFLSGPQTIPINYSESPILALTQLKEGLYVFRFTVVDNNGASAYDDIRLQVENPEEQKNKLPVVDAGRDIKTNKTTATIIANAHDPDGQIISYHWEQVMGKEIIIQNKESSSLELTGLSEGEYLFRITVADNEGARAHDDVKVIYTKKTPLIVAKKVFTPNGDGIDDTWHIENTTELQGCQLIIIDRAGNKVYEANPYQNEWDASYHGSPLPSADYYYIIRCQDGNTEAGGIRVIR